MLQQSYALTLYAFAQLCERDRVRRLVARDRDVQLGVYVAMAMNDPSKLDRERAKVLADMKADPSSPLPPQSNAEFRAAALALVQRIEHTGVLVEPVIVTGALGWSISKH